MEIHIKTIPHDKQRYPTVGDYWYDQEGVLQVRVSEMGNEKYEFLVALHEIIEEKLTVWKGITEQQIMDYDLYFEKKREMGLVGENDEPGFSPEAPYLAEHTIATGIEMMVAAYAGVSWPEYDQTVNSL